MSKNNPTSFRFPAELLSDQSDNVRKVHRLSFDKLVSLTQALGALNEKVNALSPTSGSTTTTVINETVVGSSGGGSSSANYIGTVNNQSGETSYTTLNSDNGALLILNDGSAIAVTLDSTTAVVPYFFFITNFGAGTATLTPSLGTINGGASFSLPQNFLSVVVFDGTNWWASVLTVMPQSIVFAAHKWLDSYDAATGLFTSSQPAFTDISGTVAASQLSTHDEPLTDGLGNLIFAGGDVIVVIGVSN